MKQSSETFDQPLETGHQPPRPARRWPSIDLGLDLLVLVVLALIWFSLR